jgi:hypothetical protein
VAAQSNAPPRLGQVLAADTAKRRVVANQICQLAALLHEIARRQPVDLLTEVGDAEQLAQDLT